MPIGAVIKINGQVEDLPVSEVEVIERIGEGVRFRLRVPVAIADDGDLPQLSDPRFDPGAEVMVLVQTGAGQDCLVKGPIHAHEIHLENGGDGSYLDVLGGDRTVAMARHDKVAVWPDGAISDAVSAICATYGMTADVETTKGDWSESKHALVQRDTDLGFVRKLARRNGSLFWITSDLNGVETAHFRRPDLGGEPACAININQGEPTDPLTIRFDVERPATARLAQGDFAATAPITAELSKQPLPLLGDKGLETLHKDPPDLHLAAASDSNADLNARAEGALIEASFFIQAEISATTTTVGAAVRSHTVVSLGGVGKRHGGEYLCAAVTHRIDEAVHAMDMTFVRNAWGR